MDQYHGQGGSYIVDPETGERVLLERTAPAGSEPQKPRRRARTESGQFQGDDPSTPDANEAWQ